MIEIRWVFKVHIKVPVGWVQNVHEGVDSEEWVQAGEGFGVPEPVPNARQEQLPLFETHGENLVLLYLPSVLVGKNKSAL